MVKLKAMFKECLLPQQGLALAVLLIVSTAVTLGGTTAVIASKESIPGDVLYPVKETVENVQLMSALSDEGKTNVHLSIAKGKISEIEKLNSIRASADKIGIVNKKAKIHLQKAQIIRGIRSFADCVNAGYPITQTFPTQCRTPDGKIFIDPLEPPEPSDIGQLPEPLKPLPLEPLKPLEPSDIGQLLKRLNETVGKVEPLVPSEQVITPVKPSPPGEKTIYCPKDVRTCPDGSTVVRIPPSCEFASCSTGTLRPSPALPQGKPIIIEGEVTCVPTRGGIQAQACPIGLKASDGEYYSLVNVSGGLSGNVRISGVLTPPAPGGIFDVSGIIYVSSITKK